MVDSSILHFLEDLISIIPGTSFQVNNLSLHVEHAMLGAERDRYFYKTVKMLIADVLGLVSGDSLAVLYDSRTPVEAVRVYSAVATELGAEVTLIELPRPPAGETSHIIQPKPAIAAVKAATAAISSWVTYTAPLAEAVENGVHLLSIPPGPDVPDMLIRTVGQVNMEKMDKENARIIELWENGKEITITSDLGTDLRADISGVKQHHSPQIPPPRPKKGEKWMEFVPWGQAGGSCNRVEGTLVVNGIIGARSIGIFGLPSGPITMEIKNNRIAKVKGDSRIWPLLSTYLDSKNDPNVYGFPAHGPSVGLNPNAYIGGPAEWERVRGNITFGVGDNSVLARYSGGEIFGPRISAKVHWDLQILGANLYLDGKAIVENGQIKI